MPLNNPNEPVYLVDAQAKYYPEFVSVFVPNIPTIKGYSQSSSPPVEILKNSKIERRRQIINIVFQNLELHVDQLRWKYKKPFDSMASYNNSSWLRMRDVANKFALSLVHRNM